MNFHAQPWQLWQNLCLVAPVNTTPTTAALADPQEPQWAPSSHSSSVQTLGSPSGHSPTSPQQLWQTLASAPPAQVSPTTHRHLHDSWICLPFHSGRAFPFMETGLCTPGRGQAGWHGSVPGQLPRVWQVSLRSSPGPTENAPSWVLWSWGAPCEGHSQRQPLSPPSPEPPEDPSRTCSHSCTHPLAVTLVLTLIQSHTYLTQFYSLLFSFTHSLLLIPTHFHALSPHSDTLNTPLQCRASP